MRRIAAFIQITLLATSSALEREIIREKVYHAVKLQLFASLMTRLKYYVARVTCKICYLYRENILFAFVE